MIYTFYKDGEQIQSIEAETLKEAEEKTGVKVSAESGISYTANEVERKPRKPRIDKGIKRVTKTNTSVIKKDTRKNQSRKYFVLSEGTLVNEGSHDGVIGYLNMLPVVNDKVRVIMGHEIRFSRKVQFHN